MLVPAFLWLIFFSIVPMFGIIMAFEDYNPGLGMLKSPFVGLENFRYMLQISDVRQAIVNTVIIRTLFGTAWKSSKNYRTQAPMRSRSYSSLLSGFPVPPFSFYILSHNYETFLPSLPGIWC